MSLYTIDFIFFLAGVGLVYYSAPHRLRWIILLAASLIFYASYSSISALVFGLVVLVNYVFGLSMARIDVEKRKPYMVAGIAFNLGVLIFYKFLPSLIGGALTRGDSPLAVWLILPVGLSFQILQAIGYLVEVRKGAQPAERHFGIFALYILFFPRLLAGPVEKPQSLIHQFREEHEFNYKDVTEGMKVLAWGLFKKLVIADRLGFVIATAYNDPQSQEGIRLLFASLAFFVSIYADFSGYSDIAWGAARIFGIHITQNFNHPYASLSIAEFWSRWHISLSSWLREYLYYPLGGNRKGEARTYINLILTMSL
ncbi:MAG: MBOAT family O-acyltransferase, partial [Anaerolineales bacterium]|nr:MBOAT family O-acyltransferase [Anaerolineales bacterium]